MQQTVTEYNISVNVLRAVSRLKTIFCSFDHDYKPTDQNKIDYPFLVKNKLVLFLSPHG